MPVKSFPMMAEPAARVVVSDDGSTICLTSYSETGAAVPIVLAPVRAVALAGELIRAALPKLDVTDSVMRSAPKFGLNNELAPDAEIRVRDELYRRLDNSLAVGSSLRQRAEAIRRKRNRYVPRASDEGAGGERAVLWQLHRIGAPDLSERQVRRILGGR